MITKQDAEYFRDLCLGSGCVIDTTVSQEIFTFIYSITGIESLKHKKTFANFCRQVADHLDEQEGDK